MLQRRRRGQSRSRLLMAIVLFFGEAQFTDYPGSPGGRSERTKMAGSSELEGLHDPGSARGPTGFPKGSS